ncbi:MAG: hypothetical protein ACRYG8_38020 [Janthinobacterium lividum]
MGFKANMAVRLQATSELLFIDAVDEDAAIALCRRFGSSGPEGASTPFPLDSLRENVVRAPRQADLLLGTSLFRRAACRLGLHDWQSKTFHDRPQLGDVVGKVCTYCTEVRLQR